MVRDNARGMESSGDVQLKKLIPAALALLLAPVLVLMTFALQGGTSTAQQQAPEIGADADTTGNEKGVFDIRDSCISVNNGDTFDLKFQPGGMKMWYGTEMLNVTVDKASNTLCGYTTQF